jgi:hypothetical protein
VRRALLLVPLVTVIVGCSVSSASTGATSTAQTTSTSQVSRHAATTVLPPVGHVFIIVLENESASVTFGPNSPAPYLAKSLTSEGAYLPNYHATGHLSNDNYIAMISGQAPNTDTQTDCQTFSNFPADLQGSYGQQEGLGCVYPGDIKTIAGQLDNAGLSWADYDESMGNDPTREPSVCAHPAVGGQDNTQSETATDAYATRHNPFVYFHSIIDDTTLCDTHVVNLDLLPHALSKASLTPNYVFITPDLCGDGHDATCSDKSRPGGFAGIEQFLQEWVPKITGSPAFKQQDGLLLVTFDEAATSDTSSCCGEIPGPGSATPGLSGPGGGDTGAVLLSPCIKPGTVSQTAYNHYTMLRSVEDIFKLSHLGYAGLPGEQTFGSDIFNKPCEAPPVPKISGKASGRSIKLKWSATDAGGPGVKSFAVQVRTDGKHPGSWKNVLRSTTKRSSTYTGKPRSAYQFRVRATDNSGIASAYINSKKIKLS